MIEMLQGIHMPHVDENLSDPDGSAICTEKHGRS
jgi:hypothetical protein